MIPEGQLHQMLQAITISGWRPPNRQRNGGWKTYASLHRNNRQLEAYITQTGLGIVAHVSIPEPARTSRRHALAEFLLRTHSSFHVGRFEYDHRGRLVLAAGLPLSAVSSESLRDLFEAMTAEIDYYFQEISLITRNREFADLWLDVSQENAESQDPNVRIGDVSGA